MKKLLTAGIGLGVALGAAGLTAVEASAQTPQPDVSPSPITDLSGTWRLPPNKYLFNVRSDADPTTELRWATKLREERADNYFRDRWTITCLPGGPALGLASQFLKIVQTRDMIVMLNEDLTYRQVFLDGRSLPDDPAPTFMGYSVGRWEGDTLVVESVGFKDRSWLDYEGSAHTEALRIEERYRRLGPSQLELTMTYDDPGAYTKPWTIRLMFSRMQGGELMEYVCGENEKDRANIVGKMSEETITLPPETLARYAGTYGSPGPRAPITIEVEGDHLLMLAGGKVRLLPRTETTFISTRMAVVFETDERGNALRMRMRGIEDEIVAERVR